MSIFVCVCFYGIIFRLHINFLKYLPLCIILLQNFQKFLSLIKLGLIFVDGAKQGSRDHLLKTLLFICLFSP